LRLYSTWFPRLHITILHTYNFRQKVYYYNCTLNNCTWYVVLCKTLNMISNILENGPHNIKAYTNITSSMADLRGIPWEANSYSADQGISYVYKKWRVYYRVQKSKPLGPSWTRSIQSTSYLFNIIQTTVTSLVWYRSLQFSNYFFTHANPSSSSSGSTVLYGHWPPWWSSPRYSYQVLPSTMSLLSLTLHLLRHYQATLIWVFPFSESLQAARSLCFCKVSFPSFWLNVLAILTWLLLLLWLYLDLFTNCILHVQPIFPILPG
jgi:hypothetical protein